MIEFPDVSNHEPGLNLAGAPACIAKATEGDWFTDPYYNGFRAQAVALGIPFAAYHWVDTGDLAAQAAHARAVIGPQTPVMWDAEAPGSTVDRLLELTHRYRALGGIATMVYLPRWWWRDHLGSADLRPLAAAGLALVSSDYDNLPPDGFAPYGGVTPTIWQFTSRHPFGGQLVDFNRYPGTTEQLRAVFTGNPEEDEMPAYLWTDTNGERWYVTGPMQFKRKVTAAEVGSIEYYAKGTAAGGPGFGGFTLIEVPGTADPAVIPGVDVTHLASGGAPSGPVDLTPTAVAAVADAVADEEAQRLAQ